MRAAAPPHWPCLRDGQWAEARRGSAMAQYAALDVSQETTAICLVDESGKVRRQARVATCPQTISRWFAENAAGLVRIGMETGPLAVWLWNELDAKGLPVVCMDARHANAALKMRPNKTDRNDAAALAQIVRGSSVEPARGSPQRGALVARHQAHRPRSRGHAGRTRRLPCQTNPEGALHLIHLSPVRDTWSVHCHSNPSTRVR